MIGVIYKITNRLNGKVYIGQTTNQDKNYYGSGTKIKQAIKAKGKQNFSKEILITCTTQEELDSYEELYIELYSSIVDDFGYNILPGTSNLFGSGSPTKIKEIALKISLKNKGKSKKGKFSKEFAEKVSKRLSGVPLSQSQKDNISKSLKGRKISPEVIMRMKEGMKGKKRSEEAKRNMSECRKGKNTGEDNHFYGKKHTEEAKKKISDKKKNK